jgi:hypothetical protein
MPLNLNESCHGCIYHENQKVITFGSPGTILRSECQECKRLIGRPDNFRGSIVKDSAGPRDLGYFLNKGVRDKD